VVFKLEQSNLASVCFTLVLCKFVAVFFSSLFFLLLHPFAEAVSQTSSWTVQFSRRLFYSCFV